MFGAARTTPSPAASACSTICGQGGTCSGELGAGVGADGQDHGGDGDRRVLDDLPGPDPLLESLDVDVGVGKPDVGRGPTSRAGLTMLFSSVARLRDTAAVAAM